MMADRPGYYQGIHHSDYTEALKALLRAGADARAKALLEPLLDAIEAEAQSEHIDVDAWHYQQLAQIYTRAGDHAAARAVYERYMRSRGTAGA
jgi:hypothetical protein